MYMYVQIRVTIDVHCTYVYPYMHVFYVMVYNMHIDDQDKLLHAVMNEAKTLTNAER